MQNCARSGCAGCKPTRRISCSRNFAISCNNSKEGPNDALAPMPVCDAAMPPRRRGCRTCEAEPGNRWVGQQMRLQIDVLGKDGWAQIADLSEVEVPGSWCAPAGNSRVRLNERIHGSHYSGQRYELSIYPAQWPAGPARGRVECEHSDMGAQNSTQQIAARTEAIAFTTRRPEGARTDIPLIVSADFSARQHWEPDQTDFHVGDALKRTIRLEAKDLPAMVLPPLTGEAVANLSSYPETPELSEQDAYARRTESTTFLFDQSGAVPLPAYELQWWNPETRKLQIITLEGRTLAVSGSAQAEPATAAPGSRHFKITLIALTSVVIALICILTVYKYRWRNHRSDSEPALFKRLTTALHNDPPGVALTHMLAWLDCIGERPSRFFKDHTCADTQAIAARMLADPSTATQLEVLARELKQARAQYLRSKRQRLARADAQLPPLNL